MIVYNVTVNIETEVEADWLSWMKQTHIPEVLQTGCFTEHRFLKLLNDDPEATGTTYAVQYFAPGITSLNNYLDNFAPGLQKKVIDRYSNKFVAFRTFLEEV
ncbi:MAG: DUF4286 family protein [Marinoscillum sp.]|uniref:DUF4286 family protein n=1 Tax=Marinoscillum sp. TaxID=2024838 RepID=UPI0032F3448B